MLQGVKKRKYINSFILSGFSPCELATLVILQEVWYPDSNVAVW